MTTIIDRNLKTKQILLSQKIVFSGKSYKISVKKSILNLRFNTSNIQILTFLNSFIKNKNGQKKLYIINAGLSKTNLALLIRRIRFSNTYTLRGLYTNCQILPKRSGRVSEYM